jgi:uncharacterized membrane protein
MIDEKESQERHVEAYNIGRRVGFGISALALSIVAYLSLLGLEKAVLAIVLGALALRGMKQGTLARRLGFISIILSAIFIITFLVVMFLFWDKVIELMTILRKLS